jgi:hypothetical protein
MIDVEREYTKQVVEIDQVIREAVWEAARAYCRAGVPIDQLRERVQPLVDRLFEIRAEALAKMRANLLRIQQVQMALDRLERLEAEVVH